jgi:hypothetical protein
MQCTAYQAAMKHGIRIRVPKRHPHKPIRLTFEAADGLSQGRKLVHARAGHAPLLTFRNRHARLNE